MKSTNYQDVFIEVAEDCKVTQGEIPPYRGDNKSIANLEYEMVSSGPYKYTSDDVKFAVFAVRKELPKKDLEKEREHFFSKGQPCFRASPLSKSYGWGVHNDRNGKIAIYGMETREYLDFQNNKHIKKVKAMRSKRS